MLCGACGTENTEGALACSDCGADLSGADDSVTLEAPASAGSQLLFERYQLMEELGSGGMGKVLRVLDTKINEQIALKLIHTEVSSRPGVKDRFRNELKLARRISHPNVCRVFDFDERDGTPYITMEYVPGEDLHSLLRKKSPLPVERALEIGSQICEGLGEAHRLGVVHRDLKPRNVQIEPSGQARIMDFGLARSSDIDGKTKVGTMLGTPHYMSPEQVDGLQVDHRADIYSFGIVLYEMVVGERPFEGGTALSVAIQHKSDPPPNPSERNPAVPAGLSAIILRCLEKDPKARFEGMEGLLEAIGALDGSQTGTAQSATRVPSLEDSSIELPSFVSEILSGSEIEAEGTTFVGRAEQLTDLDRRLDRALEGDGQVVFVTGSPGSGKSQLAAHFVEQAQERIPELLVVGGKCNAQTGTESPYLPFRQTLELISGDIEIRWALGRLSARQALRVWNSVPESVASLVQVAPSLPGTLVHSERLLKRARAAGVDTATLEALKQKVEAAAGASTAMEQEILDQFTKLILAISQKVPLILVLDDLHWIDRGSAGLLFHLARQIPAHRVMILGTYRAEEVRLARAGERHPMEAVVNELARDFGDVVVSLDEVRGREFVDAYLDSKPNKLDEEFRNALYEHTKGHPLFTVELLRSLRERGNLKLGDDDCWRLASEVDWTELPARTEGVVAERLGRLPEDQRELLQWASVEGEEFTAEILARVAGDDEGDPRRKARDLVRLLSQELDKRHGLVRAQGVRRTGNSRLSLYRFRHVLFQKYLYGELDEVELSYRHEDVGNAMEELYADDLEELAVPLARHFDLAGIDEKALRYSRLAGNRALTLSAYAESIPQFQKSLETLDRLPVSDERNRDELELLLSLATSLTATAGYSGGEVAEVCNRARKVAESSQQADENPILLYRLWAVHFVRGDAEAAPELALQLDAMAENDSDPIHQGVADFARGVSFFWAGAQPAAAELLESSSACYDGETQRARSLAYGLGDPLYTARIYRAWNLLLIGEAAAGWALQKENLAEAERLDEPFVKALAYVFSAAMGQDLGMPLATVKSYAVAADDIASENGLTFWLASSRQYLGWCEAMMGEESGIDRIHEGLALHESVGAGIGRAGFYRSLCEALWVHGRANEARKALASSLEMSAMHLDRGFDSEAYRLGGLIEESDNPDEAVALYRKAIEIAETQSALLFDLKASLALARLLQQAGRSGEALERLEHVIGLFGDEEIPALNESKQLLEELSAEAASEKTG